MISFLSSHLLFFIRALAAENSTMTLIKLKYKMLSVSIVYALIKKTIIEIMKDLHFVGNSMIDYDNAVYLELIHILCAFIAIQHYSRDFRLRDVFSIMERAVENCMNEGKFK